jgi:phosphoglycolate phosphatase
MQNLEHTLTILFDLDGTVIDSTDAILESFDVAFETLNTPKADSEDVKALIGFPLDEMFLRLGVAESQKWDYVAEYKKHYRKIAKEKTELLPRAKEAIELASSFATLGVVTTKTHQYSKELLEHFGVLHYFNVLIGREDVENPKPHQEPIELALSKLKRSKQNAWIIGDTVLDAKSAKNAEIRCAGVTSGYGKIEDLHKETEYIFDDLYQAVQYLKLKG